MAIENVYEKYLEYVARYLCDKTKEDEGVALLKRQADEQRATAFRNYENDQSTLTETAQKLIARFGREANAIAELHIDGLGLPERVRPKDTQHSSEELSARLGELYKEISGLRNEYVASVAEETASMRRQSAQKRREAVLEARQNAERQHEQKAHADDGGAPKGGCVGVAAVISLCALRTSLLLIQIAINLVK